MSHLTRINEYSYNMRSMLKLVTGKWMIFAYISFLSVFYLPFISWINNLNASAIVILCAIPYSLYYFYAIQSTVDMNVFECERDREGVRKLKESRIVCDSEWKCGAIKQLEEA